MAMNLGNSPDSDARVSSTPGPAVTAAASISHKSMVYGEADKVAWRESQYSNGTDRSSRGKPGPKQHSQSQIPHHTRTSQIRQKLSSSAWYYSPYAAQTRVLLQRKEFVFVMVIALLLALFLRDLWILCGVNSDIEIDIVLTVVMVMFSVEFILLSAVDASYFLSFFFIMDILGTVSMLADISFILGSSHTEAKDASAAGQQNNLMLLRASRAARVGARAGRLTRVVKILRFLPFLTGGRDDGNRDNKGMANAISIQLSNLLATRVACLTILLVMVIPLFDVLTFPQSDYALQAWVERLAENLRDGDNVTFHTELHEMGEFFDSHSYGPYQVCEGSGSSSSFTCTNTFPSWVPRIEAPPREASSLQVSTNNFLVKFNMHQPVQMEALMSVSNILFIVVIMIFSGMSLSSVVNELAVRPLERMLGTVKQIAITVFKFSAEVVLDGEETTDIEGSSEMKLLEKVVAKLAIIADLQTRDNAQQNLEDMRDEDIGILNLMQGKNIVAEAKKVEERRESMCKPGNLSSKGIMAPLMKIEDVGVTQEQYNSWGFNTLALTKQQKSTLCLYTIIQFHDGGITFVKSPEEERRLGRFVSACEKEYMENPFHNFSHASDVMHSVSRMMRVIESDSFLTELEQFCLLIASIGHDVGHPGVNNGFLSEVSHELALQYNDRSPLENMHCAKLYAIITKEEANVCAGLSREQYKDMRKMVIEAVLHTDMMGHTGMVKDLQMVFQMNSEVFSENPNISAQMAALAEAEVFSQPETKSLTMNCLLHSADVSNPCRVWEVAFAWAQRVLEEFFAQGDEEKRLKIPVQFLNDRVKLNRPNSQIGFIEFMIAPFFTSIINLWPRLGELGDNLGVNIANWENLWITESNPKQEERAKVRVRCSRVKDCLEEAKTRGLPAPP